MAHVSEVLSILGNTTHSLTVWNQMALAATWCVSLGRRHGSSRSSSWANQSSLDNSKVFDWQLLEEVCTAMGGGPMEGEGSADFDTLELALLQNLKRE